MMRVATRPVLQPLLTSIFSEMTARATAARAINLAQGFPDDAGPVSVRDAIKRALDAGHMQYARARGVPVLCQAVVDARSARGHATYDALMEVVVTAGATEAIAATMLGLLEPGDEVLAFEPVYDSYRAIAALAGVTLRTVALTYPDFTFNVAALARLVTPRTRALLLNAPHNPTGKVLDSTTRDALAALCAQHDLIAICDEVYEYLTYDGRPHLSLADAPAMRDRTIVISSCAKALGVTGLKVGWALAPAPIADAIHSAHQYLTFCAPTPLQHGVADALAALDGSAAQAYQRDYVSRRDLMVQTLREAGFGVAVPEGAYFVIADWTPHATHPMLRNAQTDVAAALALIDTVGVATIPCSAFYVDSVVAPQHMLRFAFCKRIETLQVARDRLHAAFGSRSPTNI